jgi:hypothetical protein
MIEEKLSRMAKYPRIWNKAVVANLKGLSRHSAGET